MDLARSPSMCLQEMLQLEYQSTFTARVQAEVTKVGDAVRLDYVTPLGGSSISGIQSAYFVVRHIRRCHAGSSNLSFPKTDKNSGTTVRALPVVQPNPHCDVSLSAAISIQTPNIMTCNGVPRTRQIHLGQLVGSGGRRLSPRRLFRIPATLDIAPLLRFLPPADPCHVHGFRIELRAAWQAIIETGGPGFNPEAMELLGRILTHSANHVGKRWPHRVGIRHYGLCVNG